MSLSTEFVLILFYISIYHATPQIDGIVIPINESDADERLIDNMFPYASMGMAWLINFGERIEVYVVCTILGMDRAECAELILDHLLEADNWHEYFIS